MVKLVFTSVVLWSEVVKRPPERLDQVVSKLHLLPKMSVTRVVEAENDLSIELLQRNDSLYIIHVHVVRMPRTDAQAVSFRRCRMLAYSASLQQCILVLLLHAAAKLQFPHNSVKAGCTESELLLTNQQPFTVACSIIFADDCRRPIVVAALIAIATNSASKSSVIVPHVREYSRDVSTANSLFPMPNIRILRDEYHRVPCTPLEPRNPDRHVNCRCIRYD